MITLKFLEMKKILFFLFKNLFFIQRINSVFLFLAFSVGTFLLFHNLISGQELISGCLIILLPGAYFFSELLLMCLYYSLTILKQCHELDLEQINSKQPAVYLKLSRVTKNKTNIYIGNLSHFWSKEPVFFTTQHLIKVKYIGLLIGFIMMITWPAFYEYPLGLVGGIIVLVLFYTKMQTEKLTIE